MPCNHLILCCPLFLPPLIFASIRVFSNESVLCIRWPKHWSFSFSVSPSNEHSGLISFRIDWLDLLSVQGTLKSSPISQFKSINSSVLSLLYGPTLTSKHLILYHPHQSFPASGSFQISQFFTSGGQSIGVLASASVLSINIQDWFPLGLTGWVSLKSKGLSRVFSKTTVQKHQFVIRVLQSIALQRDGQELGTEQWQQQHTLTHISDSRCFTAKTNTTL